ncbi:hypothetical protein HYC85_028779 [Camellia sinensis]|uniref:PHD-type domain-containing protein n=1 Tax=Camellia sinensis TaxID=4442 RepID=A0A7J7FYE6_CAMSI|nr:hypothetical protein HYC85_028779 [Camellia sinensis]
MEKSAEEVHTVKAFGWAARDHSGVLSPFETEKSGGVGDHGDDDDDGIECAVCECTDGDPSDTIVFCDGCDLMVHSTCYGSPLINGVPGGDWFCTQCLASQSPKNGNAKPFSCFSCCLCPVTGGAMKPTKDGRWAHIVCALFVREGVDCPEVPHRRWEQSCYVCSTASGCAIDCSELRCPLSFRVTCGLKEHLVLSTEKG